MADEKKPDAKPATVEATNVAAEIATFIIVLLLLSSLVNSVSSKFSLEKILSGNWNGLTPRSILLSHTRPIASLNNAIGVRIVSTSDTDVYDSPGGKKIGSQKIGAKGKILQGPVTIDGKKYWYVDYDSGPDGWVEESKIAYLETEPNVVERFLIWILSITNYIKLFIILFSILCFLYIIYLNMKISPILENERRLLYPVLTQTDEVVNPKWEKIQNHIESLNENDWRIAIIEADIMLGELLEKLSLPGDTIGDKLKVVEKSDFTTLEYAWEAHKIRNKISHDGQAFMMTQRDAKIVIGFYESVFKEFRII